MEKLFLENTQHELFMQALNLFVKREGTIYLFSALTKNPSHTFFFFFLNESLQTLVKIQKLFLCFQGNFFGCLFFYFVFGFIFFLFYRWEKLNIKVH